MSEVAITPLEDLEHYLIDGLIPEQCDSICDTNEIDMRRE